MDMKVVQMFAVLRYHGGMCKCIAECSSHDRAVEAIEYYGGTDSVGVYYRVELRYKVVQV